MKIAVLLLLGLAMLSSTVLGVGTKLVFQYPGYIVLGIGSVLSLFAWRKRSKFLPGYFCLLTTLLFVAYIVMRGIFSPVDYFAREDIMLVLACLCVYMLTAVVFTHPRERMALIWCLIVVGIANAVIGLVHFGGNHEFSILPGYRRTYPAGRSGGLYNNPNHFAAYMVMITFLGVAIGSFGRGGIAKRMILFFLAGIFVLQVGLSTSRGGFLAAGAGAVILFLLFLFLARKLYREHFLKIVFVGGGVVLLAVIMFGVVNYGLLESRLNPDRKSDWDSSRFYMWKAALHQASLNPLLGTGSRTYYYYGRTLRTEDTPWHTPDFEFVHNEYLQLLAEYGLVGVALGGLFLATHLWRGLAYLKWHLDVRFARTGRTASNQLALTVGALVALTASMVQAVVEFHLHTAALALPTAFLLGVLANPGFEGAETRVPELAWTKPAARIATIAAGSLFLVVGVRYSLADFCVERTIFLGDEDLGIKKMYYFNKAKKWDPKNPFTHRLQAQAWLAMIREGMPPSLVTSFVEKARENLTEAHRLFPDDSETMVIMGNCLDLLGKTDEAEQWFLMALEKAPLLFMTRLSYAIHLHRVGRFEEARAAYGQARLGYSHAAGSDLEQSRLYLSELVKMLDEEMENQ